MIMKNKIYSGILAALAVSVSIVSCRFEDEDYFDESAALRVEHFNDNVKNTLVNSEHGWVMNYFTGTEEHHFKGYNLFAQFYDSERVLMAGNHEYLRNGNANKYTEVESLYTMLEENGPVLAFNTWNDVLTVFADPVDPFQTPAQIVKDGVGMAGDYNFTVVGCEEDKVSLVGVRHQAHVRLIKCDRPWQDYIEAVNNMKEEIAPIAITKYYVTNGVDTMYFEGLRNGVFQYKERADDNAVKIDSIACCFTPRGFFIEKEQTIGEVPFQEFVMSDDNTKLVSLDGRVQCIAFWDEYAVNHTELWMFDPSGFNDAFNAAYQAIGDALQNYVSNSGSHYSIAGIGIGRTTGGEPVNGLVVSFYTNTAMTRTSSCGISLDAELSGFGKVTYSLPDNPQMDTNLKNIIRKVPEMEDAVKNFAALIVGTYDMTPDNYFLPTGATYTAVGGGLTFTLK